jgi:hypothetical protein
MAGTIRTGSAKKIYTEKYKKSKGKDKPKDWSISDKKLSNDSNKKENSKASTLEK